MKCPVEMNLHSLSVMNCNNKTNIKSNYKPREWQWALHRGLAEHPHAIHVVKSPRQVGKSVALENVVLKVAVEKSKSISMIVSPTFSQCDKIFKELTDAIRDSSIFLSANQSTKTLFLRNSSRILFRSAEQKDSLRGYTISGILCIDEAAYVDDDVFYLLLPTVDAFRAPIVLTSTPKTQSGFFFEMFERGRTKDLSVFSYDWSKDYDLSSLLTPEKLEFYRNNMPRNQFKTEYLGEWQSADSDVFGEFDAVLSNNVDITDTIYYMGVDWGTGSGSDYTAITVINSQRQMVYLDYFNDKDETSTINHIMNLIEQYKPIKCQVELNSIGKVFYGLLSKKLVRTSTQLVGFTTTNDSKHKLVSNLIVGIQNKTLQLLNNPELQIEMSMYACKMSPTGKPTYNAIPPYHDDCIMSTMLALDCVNKGAYSLGFL